MQFLGSFLQSMSHRNRSHANQPMGGILIRPLSNAKETAARDRNRARKPPEDNILERNQQNRQQIHCKKWSSDCSPA